MKPKILISRCFLGDKVRYDGDSNLLDELSQIKNKFELVSICPELEAGFGVPREPIELKNDRVIDTNGNDVTDKFKPVLESVEQIVSKHNIKTALMKEKSPSCGSKFIYDGSFSGKVISGEGIIVKKLRSLGVKVYSEENLKDLI